MFILTTKVNKKKVLTGAIFVLAVVILFSVIIAVTNGASKEAALTSVVKTNEERVAYLKALGWDVSEDAIEEQTVTIPKEFNDTYTEYNELQKKQGFDLSKYSGLEATRYTYEIKNYPSAEGRIVADILVYRNKIIGGDIQSTAKDGFMAVLEYPKEEN